MELSEFKQDCLYLDIGNSCIDWVFGTTQWGKAGDFANLVSQLNNKPQRVLMAAARQQSRRQWPKLINQQWQLTPSIAEVRADFLGLQLAYEHPQQLGVDRWLGLVALFNQDPKAHWMLVDAGTALTMDFLVANQHLGGYITPGIALMRQSCYTHIDERRDNYQNNSSPYGNNTYACVNLGTRQMAINFIICQWQDFLVSHPSARLMFTGGDGEELYTELVGKRQSQIGEGSGIYDPLLVCRGLADVFS